MALGRQLSRFASDPYAPDIDRVTRVAGKLKVLDMCDNNIRDIPEGLLQRMRNLEQLDLENNPIKFRG